MKQLVYLFTLCLVAFGPSLVQAQQPQIKILANSTEISGNLVFNGTQRLTFIVSDGKPADMGYAYEFGPIQLIPPSGTPVELRAKTVENRCVSIYSLSGSMMPLYPEGFKVKLNGIIRHNPDHSTDLLPFTAQQLEIKVIPK